MKHIFSCICILFMVRLGLSQTEFHVFPKNHDTNPGKQSGNGSLSNPWDLQTALSQNNKVVGGDIIWLHEGVYHGRFLSTLAANNGKLIQVVAKGRVVLNGHVKNSNLTAVLTVTGKHVRYQGFSVTWLGDFSRHEKDKDFQRNDGISHTKGEGCEFINLKIYNNPGSGFGSWKLSGGTKIYGCTIFNNGYFSTKRGTGVGMYIQNSSDNFRLVENNVIFNNYYKGIEVWSANKNATSNYVKNVTIKNNVVFNNGIVSGYFRDNLIIATDDENQINVAKNIQVLNNVFYHNTQLTKTIENTPAPSLTLGLGKNAPVENISVINNIILGRKDAVRILYAKSLQFHNNIVYSGYFRLSKNTTKYLEDKLWDFKENTYYSRNSKPIRIEGQQDFSLSEWYSKYKLDLKSKWYSFKEFNPKSVLKVVKNKYQKNRYRITLFSKDLQDVLVDFSNENLQENTNYTIKDVEHLDTILATGKLSLEKTVTFPMNLPQQNNKTLNNFGVYIIEFYNENTNQKQTSFITRFLNWLGL